jgi:hypothetical protein
MSDFQNFFQRAPPPTLTHPMLALIVPPNSPLPEDMTIAALREALCALSDSPELCQVLKQAVPWRARCAFDHLDFPPDLTGLLRYFRDVLKLGFGIAITPSDVTVAELEKVAMSDDIEVANAFHDAGVDFGRYNLFTKDTRTVKMLSFFSAACRCGNLDMVKKAFTWGAYCEVSVIVSAYSLIFEHVENTAEILLFLVDECGLDVNFDLRLSDSEDLQRVLKDFRGPLLITAVSENNVGAVKVLLDKGAILDCVKRDFDR